MDSFAYDHAIHLERAVGSLYLIEEPKDFEWIIKEGVWRKEGRLAKMPDMIIVYSDRAIPIELKFENQRQKAIEQLKSGREFIHQVLNKPCPYGKYVQFGLNWAVEKVGLEDLC